MSMERDGSTKIGPERISSKFRWNSLRYIRTLFCVFFPLLASHFLLSSDRIYIDYYSPDEKGLIKRSIEYIDYEIKSKNKPSYFDYINIVMNDQGYFFSVSPRCSFMGCKIFENRTSELFNTISYLQNFTITKIIECLKEEIPEDGILSACQEEYEIFGKENDVRVFPKEKIIELNKIRNIILEIFQEFRNNANFNERQVININNIKEIINILDREIEILNRSDLDSRDENNIRKIYKEIRKISKEMLENQQIVSKESKNIFDILIEVLIKSIIISIFLHVVSMLWSDVLDASHADRLSQTGDGG